MLSPIACHGFSCVSVNDFPKSWKDNKQACYASNLSRPEASFKARPISQGVPPDAEEPNLKEHIWKKRLQKSLLSLLAKFKPRGSQER